MSPLLRVSPLLLSLVASGCLLSSLSGQAATVYKSVDARGRVTFSDSPPPQAVSVEILVVDYPAPVDAEVYRRRLEDMIKVTDRMAADRRERELHRLALNSRAVGSVPGSQMGIVEGSYYPLYQTTQRSRYRRPHRGLKPKQRLYLAPQRGPALVNQYPASLVRRHYNPHVAVAFQNRPVLPIYFRQ